MTKMVLILAFAVLLGLILVSRQRVFIRDPIATVYRDDVPQTGVQVFINNSNDVLVEQKYADRATSRIMVQNWDYIPGTPAGLICMPWLACLTTDDHAPLNPIVYTGKGPYDPRTTMNSRVISFVDGDDSRVRVELR